MTKSNISKREIHTSNGIITLFEIQNPTGAFVELSTLGAGITRIVVPDKVGRLIDAVLCYENEADYWYDSPCAGKTPGRFANRIANAEFSLDGNIYHLSKNDGENSLHGGSEGFQNKIWNYEITENGVKFSLFSPDGDEGYPGNLNVTVTYTWNDNNSLDITYAARTDAPTIVNLTNHAYFNLNGVNKGNILSHQLVINSSTRVQSDNHDIPTGIIMPVASTPFDFLLPKEIGAHITEDFENLRIGKGYNHYFFIDRNQDNYGLSHAADLYCRESGIHLSVDTTMPGVMLYSGNWLTGAPKGKDDHVFKDYSGVALECQFPPDAPNHPTFPSTVLRPGELYHQIIRYTFIVDKPSAIF